MTQPSLSISIVIPTYGREQVLLESLRQVLALEPAADEVIVVDQTDVHEPATAVELGRLERDDAIRWLRLPQPSIPSAMNRGLVEAGGDIVLFLDDDIAPHDRLVQAHLAAHTAERAGLVAGRVIQPWQSDVPDNTSEGTFSFNSGQPAWISEFMGGNFSVRRRTALELGGFDENFVRVAYRFEAEFAHRYLARMGKIYFEPAACLRHLKALAGGTRTFGEHLTTWRPDHAVGAYYFGLRTRRYSVFATRLFLSIATKYHLRRPWRMPATLLGEIQGMLWAVGLNARGPRLLDAVIGVQPRD